MKFIIHDFFFFLFSLAQHRRTAPPRTTAPPAASNASVSTPSPETSEKPPTTSPSISTRKLGLANAATPDKVEDQLHKIAGLCLEGRSQKEIAERFGLSKSQISRDLKEIHQQWKSEIGNEEAQDSYTDQLDHLVVQYIFIIHSSWVCAIV